MTIGLAYDDTLSRVEISLSSLAAVSVVTVERSTNELFWETVRGGVALPISGGAALLNDYEFSDEVENFYRVLPVDPIAGLMLDGVSGSHASTPDHASLDITSDIDLRAEATLDDWASGSIQNLIGKSNAAATQNSYRLRVSATGFLEISWTEDGSTVETATSTVALPVSNGERLAVRATLDVNNLAFGRTIRFYTSTAIDGQWTQLGTDVVQAGTTSIFSGTAGLSVGSAADDGSLHRTTGIVFAAEVRSGVGGTVVADPRFDLQTHGATSFDDDAGRTWTINGGAEIIGAILEEDSITPSLEGKIWLKSIRYPFLNRPVNLLDRGQSEGRENRSAVFPVSGRSNPTAVHDLMGGKQFVHYIKTSGLNHLAEARDVDLTLAAGDVFFLHIPQGVRAPGGYVTITGSSQERMFEGSDNAPQVFELNCSVVNPPGPSVVGTVLTWGTIFNIYGSWNALLTANPTWADLLSTVGSPDDVFTG